MCIYFLLMKLHTAYSTVKLLHNLIFRKYKCNQAQKVRQVDKKFGHDLNTFQYCIS